MLDNYGLSAYKLSKESGLSESTIANILSGKNIPSINTLEAICAAFDITLSQFFAHDEPVELTLEQKELFNKWLTLTPRQKAAVYYMIDEFKQNN